MTDIAGLEYCNHFASNLRELRKGARYTQGGISEELSVPRARYASWEEGRGTPKLDTLIRIADFFQITLDELIK